MHYTLIPVRNKNYKCLRAQSITILLFLYAAVASAQSCPPNIDFETGTFAGWTCYTGYTAAVNGENQINLTPSGPVPDRHTIYPANSGLKDPFGNFPVSCPNGSGFSVKLGNTTGGGEAEGMSYEFTIPANQNEYSLIYHYAVVFQDPNHQQFQQPRMSVEILDVTDNVTITCSSFTFIPFGTVLPGFTESATRGDDGTPVWFKDWSAVSINLDSLAGKTIKLFFKTADCTFRRHFGYAYIDVNSECSSEFTGASYCPDDTAVTVIAPYGYQRYTWYNNNFTQVLGSSQSIRFSPPPPAGTFIAVEVIPYSGYGCIDTLYARLVDTFKTSAYAGPDKLFCGDTPVSLGAIPKPGYVYNWGPSLGLSDSSLANPFASPDVSTNYILSVRSVGGGCLNKDTVQVLSSSLDSSLKVSGKLTWCLGSGDSTVLIAKAADSIQWFKNGVAVKGATKTGYKVLQSGSYYAMLFSNLGCTIRTRTLPVFIDQPKPGIRYPVEYAISELPYDLQAREFGIKYLWQPPSYLNNPAVSRPVFTSPTDQLYTIRIETNTGCVTVDTLLVKTVPAAAIYVPTAFTPNNDGLNDVLRPKLMGIKQLQYFRVYNRWGQLLFETKNANTGWDGRIGGAKQPTGVVVWVAEATGSDGKTYTRKGTCILVR